MLSLLTHLTALSVIVFFSLKCEPNRVTPLLKILGGSRVLDEAYSLLYDIWDPSRSGFCSPVQPHLLSLSWAFHTEVLAFLQQVISVLTPGLACALSSTWLFYFMPIKSHLFTLQDLAQSGSLP